MKRWPLHKAHFWETAPFFRILLPFAAGVVCYYKAGVVIAGGWLLAVAGIAFLLLLAGAYLKEKRGFYRVATFCLLNILMLSAGLAASWYGDIRNNKQWFGNTVHSSATYLLRINDAPAEKEHSWKLPVTVISAIENGKPAPVTGNAFLYLYKDGAPMLLHKGDSILAPGKWQLISNAGNPFEFDYAGYCIQNNLFYQQTCSANGIRLYASGDPAAAPFITKAHDWCMAQLDKYISEPKTKGLVQAMLLGDEVNLDEDLRQSYADTGIIHIIAISGGNVAIFFMVISALLWWLRDKKHLWIKYAIALPLVWFYVVMAGAPPSAVRAAFMFSLLAGSVILQKNSNSLNTLFTAAFLLLAAEPVWLFSVGFQLSFVAVLSLVLFYKPIYKWLSPAHKVTRLLWGTVVASIAAEALVAPLVIYYFHTFPLLFIVANVAAYLFMGLVLWLSIAIILLSFIPVAAKVVGIITVGLVTVFDKLVTWLQGLNPVSFHFLVLGSVELVIAYAAITGIALFLMRKQKPALFTGLVFAMLLLVSFCHNEWVRLHQNRFVVYNTAKVSHIELVKGATFSVLHTDTGAVKKTDYAARPVHTYWQAWKKDSAAPREIFCVAGKTVLLLNNDISNNDHFPVDYLVVNYTGNTDLAKLQRIFTPTQIILCNNYTQKQQDKMVKEARGINIFAVSKNGAFVLN